jgi:hypothetical protein
MPAPKTERRAGETFVNSKWPKVMAISAVTTCCLLYDITTATEAPRLALAILQYALLACALVALVGSAVMSATADDPGCTG